MSKSKKNVIEPNEILESYGIDATRIFMVSDSPPDRELEWTDEGIQSSKNLIHRIERYFKNKLASLDEKTVTNVEKYVDQMEKNILNFSLNKCVANIYTLFNYLEKSKIYLSNNPLSKKVLICMFPILPRLSTQIYEELFNDKINNTVCPTIDQKLLETNELILPIQVKGKMVTTIKTTKGYSESEILKSVYELDKIKSKMINKKILKVINVQDKIINIITN